MFEPDPTANEKDLAVQWLVASIILAVMAGLALMVLGWPITDFLAARRSPAEWWDRTVIFFGLLVQHPREVFPIYKSWYQLSMKQLGIMPPAWFVAASISLFILAGRELKRPYRFVDTTHGKARRATYLDVKRDRLFDRTGIILGRWGNSHRMIRNWETTSAILIAPPGTAKTVQLITNLLADWPDRVPAMMGGSKNAAVPAPCMIVNDPKGEMYKKTAGWRSTVGPVYRISWGDPARSVRFNPLSPKSYPGGERCIALRRLVIEALDELFGDGVSALNQVLRVLRDYENWEQMIESQPDLAGDLKVPPAEAGARLMAMKTDILDLQRLMAEREKHVDRQCSILVPDSVEQHWRITGREFGSGAVGFHMARSERLGEEPSYGRLLDWLNGASKGGAGYRDLQTVSSGEQYETTMEEGKQVRLGVNAFGSPDNVGSQENPMGGDADQDLTAELLDKAIEEAELYGYPARIAQDLRATRMKPDRERGSVVSTFAGSIAMFKNAAVRAVTSTSSFPLSACRGIRDDKGVLRPATFYIVISLEDAEFLGRITGLFLETVAAYAISQDEDEFKTPWEKKGLLQGRPLLFVLDEFWTLPALQSVLQIPALGRGQWVSMILVGQSYGQIGAKYRATGGSDTVDTLKAATNYKIIPTQNDFKTAEEISKTIGNRTIKQRSEGRRGMNLGAITDSMWGKQNSSEGVNYNTSLTGVPLFRPEDIMSMEKLDSTKKKWGWQLVQIAGSLNRPIYCRPSCWFKHPRLVKRAGMPVKQWALVANSNDPPRPSRGEKPAKPGRVRKATVDDGVDRAAMAKSFMKDDDHDRVA